MNVQRLFGMFMNGLANRKSERNIGDELTVHNVDVNITCGTAVDHFDVALQVCKIRGQYRRGNFSHEIRS
ncbi:hypothetical protein D3C87_2020770 [compost metagenome]